MSASAASTRYRVIWGLGRHEDFDTPAEADARASEIHAEMVEDWPLLAGTSDAALPRVIEVKPMHAAHAPDCASLLRLHDPGPEGEGTFDERGWYHPPCDCAAGKAYAGSSGTRSPASDCGSFGLNCGGAMSGKASDAARIRDRVPWYVRQPGTFFEPRPDEQSFLARVWIITGWRWAGWLLRRGHGR